MLDGVQSKEGIVWRVDSRLVEVTDCSEILMRDVTSDFT